VATDDMPRLVLSLRTVITRNRSFQASICDVPLRVLSSATHQRENFDMSSSPISWSIQERIEQGSLRYDRRQIELAQKLDALRLTLINSDASVIHHGDLNVGLFSDAKPKGFLESATLNVNRAFLQMRYMYPLSTTPKGLYVYGSVGVGKSFLMDLFVNSLTGEGTLPNRQIRRVHFHEFMLDIHDRIHRSKQRNPRQDPLPSLALSIAQESRVLCLDEFQVTDVADAAILKRLLEMLWSSRTGVVLVATSNRAPEALYEGGLNRSMFLPFIDTLKCHMDVSEMSGTRDYRREKTNVMVHDDQSYYWPADNPYTRQSLERIFFKDDGEEQRNRQLPVRMGRHVQVPRSNNHCAWFDFEDLCNRPLGAADYLCICEMYDTLIVDHVPQLDGTRFNEARRFVTLVDAVYESKTRLVLASNEVPLKELFVGFDATVESSDGDEETAVAGLPPPTHAEDEIFVKGEGGSSSSAATTMIRTKGGDTVEWSATGRIGVSLAQLSAVKDVSFSFQRAESRLAEINSDNWGR
jgi:peroxisome-assembly ATPase